MAAGKLQEIMPTRPITYRNQNLVNLLLLALAVGAGVYLASSTRRSTWPASPVDRRAVAASSACC